MISLLLAEAVLEQNRRVSEVKESRSDVYIYGPNGENVGFYNIYELAHKCKEWAFYQGFHIFIYRVGSEGTIEVMVTDNTTYYQNSNLHDRVVKFKNFNNIPMLAWGYDSEPEAIFKACQWILDNKDK